jgi:hypothetical protein
MPHPMNGLTVDRSRVAEGNTVFIPLPRELWTICGDRCGCQHCETPKGAMRVAYWDTLAMTADPNLRDGGRDVTWLVHRPEGHPHALRGEETQSNAPAPHVGPHVRD